ncbi:MAG TPA: hypothetical protein VKE74_07645, partial [Gemmataceae bacterium]|nr:hypothetical protein [Gemmataceae bacterium]
MHTARPDPAFDRHQARRGRDVPTISVLAGPVGLGVRAWRGWADTHQRAVTCTSEVDPATLTVLWVGDALATANPSERAVGWLATATGRKPDAVAVGRMTRYDLDQLWRLLPTDPATPTARAAYLILTDLLAGARTEPARLVGDLTANEPDTASGAVRAVRALTGLYPDHLWPSLLLVQPPATPDAAGWLASALRVLETLAVAVPRLPVVVAVSPEGYVGLVTARPASRAAALAREGLVELRGVSGNQLEERLRAAGVEPLPPPATVRRLTTVGLAEEVAAAFVAAARAVRHPTPAEAASDFRSLHE